MSRKPSDATKVRALTAEVKRLQQELSGVINDRHAYRVRATKAEQEAAEWKARFDTLLRREPLTPNASLQPAARSADRLEGVVGTEVQK